MGHAIHGRTQWVPGNRVTVLRFSPTGVSGVALPPGPPVGVARRLRLGLVIAVAGLVLSAAMLPGLSAVRSPNRAGATASPGRSSAPMMPLEFTPNVGQTDPAVRFVAQGPGYAIFLTQSEVVLSLQRAAGGAGATSPHAQTGDADGTTPTRAGGVGWAVVRMQLVGANAAAYLSGERPLASRTSYIVGKNPRAWHAGVATFSQVRYANVYPGIDMVVHAKNAQPEFDFVLSPGADPNKIQWHIAGAQELSIAPTGALVEDLSGGGQIEEQAPHAFQQITGATGTVPASFQLLGGDRVGFTLGRYDRSRALTIDPVIAYSTFIGGDETDGIRSPTLDAAGDVYAVGSSNSLDFPTTAGAYETLPPGSIDRGTGSAGVVLTEFSPQGQLLRSTYFGGYLIDYLDATSLALGPSGIYIGGVVSCGNNYPPSGCDLPVSPNAFEPTYKDQSGMSYVARFDLTLSTLDYSSYFGGTNSNSDEVTSVAVDANGDLLVTGRTWSGDFPTTPNAYRQAPGSGGFSAQQGFLSVVSPNGSALVYSTLFGDDTAGDGVVAGPCRAGTASTCAYLTGITRDAAFPTTRGVFQPQCPSGVVGVRCTAFQGFVSKFDPTKSGVRSLVYSSYLGGNNEDEGMGGIRVDASGDAYVAGITHSSNFPTCPGPAPACASHTGQPFKNFLSGSNAAAVGGDGFVTKVNPTASRLLYSSYVSGPEAAGCQVTFVNELAIDRAGNAYMSGSTCDPQFPMTSDAFETTLPSQPLSTFLAEISPKLAGDGSGQPGPSNPTLVWSTFFPGDSSGITVDSSGGVWLAGDTNYCGFPTSTNAYQQYLTGALGGATGSDYNGILVRILPGSAAPISMACPGPPPAVSSGPGTLDAGFGSHGIESTAMSGQSSSAAALVAQADGKFITAGTLFDSHGQPAGGIGLARYTSSGVLDTTFGSGGTTVATFSGVVLTASAAALQPDGKLLVAGTYVTPAGAEGVAIVRFHADDSGGSPGSVDTSFGADGIAEVPEQGSVVNALVLEPDGKALVGGEASTSFLLARFHAYDSGYAPGTLDSSFGGGGVDNLASQTGDVRALAIQPMGSTFAILAGGQDTGPNNSAVQVFSVRRYHATNGSLDTSFGSGGEATTDFDVPVAGGHTISVLPSVSALAVQPNGDVVAGGSVFYRDASQDGDFALARYTSNGAADTRFGSGGKVVSDVYDSAQFANALALGPGGTIILAGASNGTPPASDEVSPPEPVLGFASYFLIERFLSSGQLDSTFGNGGAVETTFGSGEYAHATGVSIQPSDGKIVVGGDACTAGAGCRMAIARYGG